MRGLGSISRLVCLLAGLAVLALGGALSVEAAVTLVDFNASGQSDKVVLNWVTASEVKTVGFNLYRATSKSGPWSKVNSGLIGSKGTVTGGNYSFTDPGASNRAAYYYRLDEVELDGKVTTVAIFPEDPTPTPTATPAATATPQPTLSPPTATPTSRPSTSTPVPTATSTRIPLATATRTPVATSTPVPVATSTPVPVATSTPVPVATFTPVPVAASSGALAAVPTAPVSPVSPVSTILPAATATGTPAAAMGPVTPVSGSGSGGAAATGQDAGKPQPTIPSPAPTQAGGDRSAPGPTPISAGAPASGALALASGPAGVSRDGQNAGSSQPPAQTVEPGSPSRGLSPIEMGAGGLVGLGILGILASLVWSLVRYRRA